ncbi:hypothetical protein ACFRR6_27040 [Streptomyces sp. NPDC056891]|uniref:hypothetical protein n=1 Tax=Streptomyces sp. NPDC056891 TaxID=3345961 RepID=UPI0036ABFFED
MARHTEPTACGGGPQVRSLDRGGGRPVRASDGRREALLPGLVELFTLLASGSRPGTVPVTPPVAPWRVRYAGRFRHYGRPAADVWTAETFGCPACGGVTGPWTVTCGEGRMSLGCPCGVVTHDHGLAFSEVWLVLPDS